MQENEFEKGIRKQMETFSLVPTEEVWKKVEIKIRADKSKKRLLYWMFTGFLVVGGTVGIFVFNGLTRNEITGVSIDQKPATNLPVDNEVNVKKGEISAGEKDLAKAGAKASEEIFQPSAKTKATKRVNPKNTYTSTAPAAPFIPGVTTSSKFSEGGNNDNRFLQQNQVKNANGINNSVSQPRMEGKSDLPPHKYLLSQNNQLLQQNLQKKETAKETGISDSAVLQKQQDSGKTAVRENNKKWKLGFAFSAGLSDNVTGIGLISAKSFSAAEQRSPVFSQSAPSSSNIITFPSALQYKSGASFGAGLYLQRAITNKLSATVGVNYSFMSTTSQAGNKVDMMLTIYDSLLQKPTMVQPFYRAGNSTTYSNTYHLIQVPINLRFQLNKNSDRPFLFSIGLSPSFLVATNALYLNNKAGVYYREEKQFDRFILFSQAEFLYTVSNKNKYQLQLGPALQYGFNSFSKTATQTQQHLLFTGLKANITFK